MTQSVEMYSLYVKLRMVAHSTLQITMNQTGKKSLGNWGGNCRAPHFSPSWMNRAKGVGVLLPTEKISKKGVLQAALYSYKESDFSFSYASETVASKPLTGNIIILSTFFLHGWLPLVSVLAYCSLLITISKGHVLQKDMAAGKENTNICGAMTPPIPFPK